MKILKILGRDFLWLLFCLPFWLINVAQICTIFGLFIALHVCTDCGENIEKGFLGSYLKMRTVKYWGNVKERANAD